MKIPKHLLWIVIVALWLAIFFMLTPIMILLTDRNIPPTTVDVTDSPFHVHYSIDSVTVNDNLFKDVEITGWSFIENDGENEDKEVLLNFVSEENTYQVGLNVFDRGDLPAALPDLKVPKHNTGFMGSFSPIALKNGLYHLYIYNKENQELYGVADTGRIFLLDNGVFKEMSGSEDLEVTNPDK